MKLSKTEKLAISITVAILVVGYIVAVYTKPVNFARAGALVTLIGIVFAALDLSGKLDRLFGAWVDTQIEEIGPVPLALGVDADRKNRERQERRDRLVRGIRMGFQAKKEQAKTRLRIVEGLILAVGTLVWAFGDLLVKG